MYVPLPNSGSFAESVDYPTRKRYVKSRIEEKKGCKKEEEEEERQIEREIVEIIYRYL